MVGIGRAEDLTGMIFGRLTAMSIDSPVTHPGGKVSVKWVCACECGNSTSSFASSLKSGRSMSCGCLREERKIESVTRHGMTKSRVHNIWRGILDRCNSPGNPGFKDYGGRGITVCDRWLVFENFLSDMGEPPDGMSIDRKNNDSGYSPDNCRWSSRKEQQRNTRRNRFICYNGESLCVAEWAERIGICHSALSRRIQRNGIESALTKPVKRKTK